VVPFFDFDGVFVRFSTRGVQKRHKNLFGGSPCQKLFAKKVEGENFPLDFPFDFFYRVFWPFLCMSSKTPLKYFLKSDRKISKILKKSNMGTYLGVFFLRAPWVCLPLSSASSCCALNVCVFRPALISSAHRLNGGAESVCRKSVGRCVCGVLFLVLLPPYWLAYWGTSYFDFEDIPVRPKGPEKKKSVTPVVVGGGQRPKKDQGQIYFVDMLFMVFLVNPPHTEKHVP
jgi:hypothetical protein